jgi:hypothetical protein
MQNWMVTLITGGVIGVFSRYLGSLTHEARNVDVRGEDVRDRF